MRKLSYLALAAVFTAPLALHAQNTEELVNEPVFAAPKVAIAPKKSAVGAEVKIFNGQDLTGWEGDPNLWSVEDGAITGRTTAKTPAKANTFLIWKGGDVGDFELSFKYKITPGDASGFGNSGVQYRSKIYQPSTWLVGGYQADFEVGPTYSGILYEEKGRGILAQRGERVVIKDGEAPDKPIIEKGAPVGDSNEIQAAIKQGGWNDYKIVAKGNHLQHFINGKQTIDVTDEGSIGAKKGILALQLHAGAPMEVQFKDMVLKRTE